MWAFFVRCLRCGALIGAENLSDANAKRMGHIMQSHTDLDAVHPESSAVVSVLTAAELAALQAAAAPHPTAAAAGEAAAEAAGAAALAPGPGTPGTGLTPPLGGGVQI